MSMTDHCVNGDSTTALLHVNLTVLPGNLRSCHYLHAGITWLVATISKPDETAASAYSLRWNSSGALKLPTAYRVWSSPLPLTWASEFCHRLHQCDSQPLPPSPPVANGSHRTITSNLPLLQQCTWASGRAYGLQNMTPVTAVKNWHKLESHWNSRPVIQNYFCDVCKTYVEHVCLHFHRQSMVCTAHQRGITNNVVTQTITLITIKC